MPSGREKRKEAALVLFYGSPTTVTLTHATGEALADIYLPP